MKYVLILNKMSQRVLDATIVPDSSKSSMMNDCSMRILFLKLRVDEAYSPGS